MGFFSFRVCDRKPNGGFGGGQGDLGADLDSYLCSVTYCPWNLEQVLRLSFLSCEMGIIIPTS